jgi:uracil phosphoribosyltransferase
MAPQLRVYVPPHPIIRHWLTIAREKHTPVPLFRTAMIEMGKCLTYEAVRELLPTQ